MVLRYSIAVIGGPTVGPLIGSAITESYLGVSSHEGRVLDVQYTDTQNSGGGRNT